MPGNLLKNPNGDEDLEHWELTENGGDQWRTEDMPGDCGHAFNDESVTKYFCTSFEPCLKRQIIDLLAEGYDPENLDIAQPAVTVEDWYCSRTDCGCIYKLTVSLLDENNEVITEFNSDEVTLDPDCDDCSWTKDLYICLRKQRYKFWYACHHGGGEGFMGRKLTAVTKIGYPLTLMHLIKINYGMWVSSFCIAELNW
uniref:F-box only protein 2-like n=1 Tax=Cyprinus carpio TaxID=7962 RepID=A0A8C2ELG9_CYPCA